MTANVRQTLGRSTALSQTAITTSEHAISTAIQYQGGNLNGPLGVRELRVKKTAGGAATITVRVYNDASKTILLLEDDFVFTADGGWDSFQPETPVYINPTDALFFTGESAVGAGHAISVYIDFERATQA